jgi:hypothetical protein
MVVKKCRQLVFPALNTPVTGAIATTGNRCAVGWGCETYCRYLWTLSITYMWHIHNPKMYHWFIYPQTQTLTDVYTNTHCNLDYVFLCWYNETWKCDISVSETSERFLGVCAKLWKATISFVISIRSAVRNNSATTERILMKLDVLLFWKSVEKIQVSLKSDKNNRYFTRRHFHVYDSVLLNSS